MENSTVIIKPTKNPKTHFVEAIHVMEKKNGGQVLDTKTGKYSGSRFPGTIASKRIAWDSNRRKYAIDLEKEELDLLVVNCKFTHESGSKKGQLITEADPFDRYDPFFNHSRLTIKFIEGQQQLLLDNPMDKIMLNGFRKNKEFGSTVNGPIPKGTRFIITDAEKDKEAEANLIKTEIEAIAALHGLSHNRRVAIGATLGLRINDKTNPDSVLKSLALYIKGSDRTNTGKLPRELFLELVDKKSEDLEVKHLVSKAKAASVLRFKKGEGYFYNGEVIAANDNKLELFIKDPNNKDIVDGILLAIEEKG